MDSRAQALQQWLQHLPGFSDCRLQLMVNDASFRRYFRVFTQDKTFVAMDAPPDKEKCEEFIKISELLLKKQLQVPQVYAKDLAQGFLVLSDLGNDVLLKKITLDNAEFYYQEALNNLTILQGITDTSLPVFSTEFMMQELLLFQEWFLNRYLQINIKTSDAEMLKQNFLNIAEKVSKQPYKFMHRDYHSANLMILPDKSLGILDFQDAFMGPMTYDLVSLLKDCYIDWPPSFVNNLALTFKRQAVDNVENEIFLKWFHVTGLQRHLKALLTFSRKFKRDDNANYLQYIPRTLNYIMQELQSLGLAELHAFFDKTVLPKAQEVALCAP